MWNLMEIKLKGTEILYFLNQIHHNLPLMTVYKLLLHICPVYFKDKNI